MCTLEYVSLVSELYDGMCKKYKRSALNSLRFHVRYGFEVVTMRQTDRSVRLVAKKQVGIYNEIAFSAATMNSKFGCILHGYTRRNACDGVTEELVDSCGLD